MLLSLKVEDIKNVKIMTTLVHDYYIYSPAHFDITLYPLLRHYRHKVLYLIPHKYYLFLCFIDDISSTALISSTQFQQNAFWQDVITSHCTIQNKRVTATSTGHFCLAELPLSSSHAIGTVYFVNFRDNDVFIGQWKHIATDRLSWDCSPFLTPPPLL